tara:strand:- start:186 stop:986 length:801 start_codon:yes stop_codon:yes gene_type:complete
MGKITIKPVSKHLQNKAKPETSSHIRSSLSDDNVGEYYYVDVSRIVRFRNQPRIYFDEQEIQSLSETIKAHGIRQPLTVILNEENKYEVVSGERRLRAAKLAGLAKVPCIIIKDITQAEELSIIENVQRSDLNPIEIGLSLMKLIEKGLSQKDIATKLSLGKSKVSELVKYASIPKEMQDYVIQHRISSRDVLRDILNGKYTLSSLENKFQGHLSTKQTRSRSVFRVGIHNGEYKIQKSSLSALTSDQKVKLRKELNLIIKEYLSE